MQITWEVRNLGVKVAALMTPEIIRRRLGEVKGASRIVLPSSSALTTEASPAEASSSDPSAMSPAGVLPTKSTRRL